MFNTFIMDRNSFKIFVLLSLAIIVCDFSFSQTFNAKHLDVKQGLSNNNITDIIYDKKGVIWIATESGLNRFDGNEFKIFRENNSKLVSDALNTLLYDSVSNSLWIGSQRDGISVLNCETLEIENYTTFNSLSTNDITHLSHSVDGAGIWITHYHVGIEYYDKKNKTFTLYGGDGIKDFKNRNWCSMDDGKGNIYVGHDYNGMSIINTKNKTVRNFVCDPNNSNSLPANNVRAIYQDSKNNIWIGTDRGLALFDPNTNSFTIIKNEPNNDQSLSSNFIYSISEINNELWIATEMSGISILNLNGLNTQDRSTYIFRSLKNKSEGGQLSSGNIRCITKDLYDNIWIGHYHKGIDFLSNTPPVFRTLTSVDEQKGDLEKEIWSIALDKQQQILLGSHNEVSIFQDYKLKKAIDIRTFLSGYNKNGSVSVIKVEETGTIWIGTTNTDVIKHDPVNSKTVTIKIPDGHGYIRDFLFEQNKIWIASDNGLFSFENDKLKEETQINNLLTDRTIYNLRRDEQGRLWIGTFGKGIFVLDQNNTLLSNFEKQTGFCSNAINDIFQDSKGRIWIATREGLVCFPDPSNINVFIIYNEQEGLADRYLRAIQEDKLGNIWLSTNVGITLYNEKENKFINYNYQDGVSSGNFINASRCINKEGLIFFASINDVCYFDPNHLIQTNTKLPNVEIIQSLLLDKGGDMDKNKVLYPSINDCIELSYNENSIQITYSVTDYSKEQFVEYEYQMLGSDNNWHAVRDNMLVFRNLHSGEYIFNIKAKLKNQEWEDVHITSLKFIINPPIWLTWYAKLLYSILVLIILYTIFYFYRKRTKFKTMLEIERRENLNKEELNNERLSFYTNITHELRTPLTLILGPLEDLKHEKDLAKQQKQKITTIHNSALRLLNLVNQLLEFRKTETQNRQLMVAKSNISNQIKDIITRYKSLNTNSKLQIQTNIEKDVYLYYDTDMLVTIMNNLLGNAIKYTPQGQITLELYTIDQYTEIIIGDTGYGIEEEKLPLIFERYYQVQGKHQASGTGIGLALVKSLVKLHDATLDVNSTIGEGTTFTLRFLTENKYPKAIHIEDRSIIETIDDNYLLPQNEEDKETILVVDDDDEIRSYIISTLGTEYNILSAKNGQEGIDIAKKQTVSLVVSDIMMPIMDGVEFAKLLKEDINTSHIPIILLTAKDSIQDRELGYEIGVDSYITKPFSASLLGTRIENLLKARRKIASLLINHDDITNCDTENKISEDTNEPSIQISRLDKEFLEKFTKLIEEHLYMDSLDMTFIKDNMNMSYSSFYRKVKSLTEVPPNEFIRKHKLKKSVELLDQNIYSIAEVAYMSGFNDAVYFRKCFKDEYKITPSEYTKKQL